MKSLFVVLALASCALGACTASTHHDTPLNTPSGHPEVMISRTADNKVKAALVREMIAKGFHVTKDTPSELAFDKPLDDKQAQAILGNKVTSTANGRITYSITKVGDDVRVVADLTAVTNPGSASELSTDMNDAAKGAPVHDVQSFLEDVRTELNGAQTSTSSLKKPVPPPPTGH
jgi:hypothetical protein